jgi:hypothetical protein
VSTASRAFTPLGQSNKRVGKIRQRLVIHSDYVGRGSIVP